MKTDSGEAYPKLRGKGRKENREREKFNCKKRGALAAPREGVLQKPKFSRG